MGKNTKTKEVSVPGPVKLPRKKSKLLRFLFFLLAVCIALPLGAELVFFLMRLSPGQVIPDTFNFYVRADNPPECASRLLAHEALPELLLNPALASLAPALNSLRKNGALNHAALRFALRGSLHAALLESTPEKTAPFIAAWDSAFLAPLLPALPWAARFKKIPGLSHVEGEISYFEYRGDNGTVIYAGRRRNLLIVSNDREAFTKAVSREGADNAAEKHTVLQKQDLSLLLASKTAAAMLGENNPLLTEAFTRLSFPELLELGIVIEPKQLNIQTAIPIAADNAAFAALLAANSVPPSLMNILPSSVQYCTGLSSLTFRELLDVTAELRGTDLRNTLNQAEKASKTLLGLTLDDILYSWTADEFAVFGLEDRPAPVFAVKIGDEAKRQAVFDRAFRSLFLDEDTRLMLDGTRIPRIAIPSFVNAILRIIKVDIPEPYYMVYDGWLLVSESPENILAAVTASQQNRLLAATERWRKLSGSGGGALSGRSDNASLSLYYSLNRSLPFFLKGGSPAASILRMYRQGLFRLAVKDKVITLTLAVEPDSGKGLDLAPGYPLNLGRKAGNRVYAVMNASGTESRLLLSRETAALSVNPSDHTIYELASDDPVWVIPAAGLVPKTMKESAAWVVSSRGLVSLVNGNMELSPGFPVITGFKPSAAPVSWNGKVYLSVEEDGKGIIYTVDSSAAITRLEGEFESPLLSPPSFLEGSGNAGPFMAVYPKSFLGTIFLCGENALPKTGWPLAVPGIAYGSPLLFRPPASRPGLAFITMAGELAVYTEEGKTLSPFPLELEGVFYLQPVWDGLYFWTVSEEGMLYRIGMDGAVTEQRIPGLAVNENGFILAADVDGDGIPEVFITGEGNVLYGYSRNLVSIEGFPLAAWGRPAFADLDGDGSMDCAAAGMDNKLYRWRFR